MRPPPPDRLWIEFETRRDIPPTAFFFAPLILGIGILAVLLIVCLG